MTALEWILASVFGLVAILVWVALLFLVPRNLTSLFRYQLWQLRDEFFDAVTLGKLPDNPVTRDFLSNVEGAIEYASRITLLHWILLPQRPESVEQYREFVESGLKEFSDDSKALFESYRKQFAGVLRRRLTRGSVSGWVFVPLAMLARPLLKAAAQRLQKVLDRGEAEPEEFFVDETRRTRRGGSGIQAAF